MVAGLSEQRTGLDRDCLLSRVRKENLMAISPESPLCDRIAVRARDFEEFGIPYS